MGIGPRAVRRLIGDSLRRGFLGHAAPSWAHQLPPDIQPPQRLLERSPEAIPLYWWRPLRTTNFGDELSWLLVQRLSGRPVRWRSPSSGCLVGVGSVLELLPTRARQRGSAGTRMIWGTGSLFGGDIVAVDVRYCAVRGQNTLGVLPRAARREVLALGDPALLASRLFPMVPGGEPGPPVLIPHRLDGPQEGVARLSQAVADLTVCPATASPLEVMDAVAQAPYVVSSSLHGLVLAHSYGVPAIWTQISDQVEGGRFKYDDFHSALDIHVDPVSVDQLVAAGPNAADLATAPVARPRLISIQDALVAAFATAIAPFAASAVS